MSVLTNSRHWIGALRTSNRGSTSTSNSEKTGSSNTPRSDLRLRGIFVVGVLLALRVLVTLYYLLDLIGIDGRRKTRDSSLS